MKPIYILPFLLLTACAPNQGQNRYSQYEVGQQTELYDAVVIGVKQVAITGNNTGTGAGAGAALGATAGYQFGNGNGQLAALLVGAVVGGIAGHIAEQEAREQVGYEYIVKVGKQKKSVVQYQNKDDVVFKKGDKALLQVSGSYQRLIPVE